MKKLKYILPALVMLFLTQSCDDMLVFPDDELLLSENALNTPDDLQRLLNSCYDVYANTYNGRTQVIAELLSDNLQEPPNNNNLGAVWNRSTNFFNGTTNGLYPEFYRAIYRINTLLEGFDGIEGLTSSERNRIEAEGKFLRALGHWQVAMLWAQPYGYTSDNSHLGIVLRTAADRTPQPRSTVQENYNLITSDLAFARENLPENNGNYANKGAAYGLSAMVYMQMMDWSNASQFASLAVDQGFATLGGLDRFTLDPSVETLFGTVSVQIENEEGGIEFQDNRSGEFSAQYRSDGSNPELKLSTEFVSLMQNNPSDNRFDLLDADDPSLVAKFNKNIFSIPIIHLTYIKLLRAEALGYLGTDLGTAINDINDIRDRAFGTGINSLSESATAEQVVEAARIEIRKETVCEGLWINHLKRMGAMGEDIEVRGAPWDCPGMAIQFPNDESSIAGFVFNEEGGCE